MIANRGIWKLYHGSMPIVNTRVICQLWYMEVIPWLWLLHSWQTVVYVVYTTGGAFDLYSSHSTSYSYIRKSHLKACACLMLAYHGMHNTSIQEIILQLNTAYTCILFMYAFKANSYMYVNMLAHGHRKVHQVLWA